MVVTKRNGHDARGITYMADRESFSHIACSLVASWKWVSHRLYDTLWEEGMEQVILWKSYYMSKFLVGYRWYDNIIKPAIRYIIKFALICICICALYFFALIFVTGKVEAGFAYEFIWEFLGVNKDRLFGNSGPRLEETSSIVLI